MVSLIVLHGLSVIQLLFKFITNYQVIWLFKSIISSYTCIWTYFHQSLFRFFSNFPLVIQHPSHFVYPSSYSGYPVIIQHAQSLRSFGRSAVMYWSHLFKFSILNILSILMPYKLQLHCIRYLIVIYINSKQNGRQAYNLLVCLKYILKFGIVCNMTRWILRL